MGWRWPLPQQRQHGPVALAFQGQGVGRVQELARLLAAEPVPCPHALLLHSGYANDGSWELGREQVVVRHLAGQCADRREAQVIVAGARL